MILPDHEIRKLGIESKLIVPYNSTQLNSPCETSYRVKGSYNKDKGIGMPKDIGIRVINV